MSGYCLGNKTQRAPSDSKLLGCVTLVTLWLATISCGGAPPPPPAAPCNKPEMLTVRFEPHPQLNPDREGYPRSVVVRMYQLEGADAFATATFEDLWAGVGKSSPSVVAGPDELTLIPGRRETRSVKRNAKTTHVALTANFREYHPDSGWKAVLELPQAGNPCAENAPKLEVTAELANYTLQLR
jgi:type VI secretion system protein VasD